MPVGMHASMCVRACVRAWSVSTRLGKSKPAVEIEQATERKQTSTQKRTQPNSSEQRERVGRPHSHTSEPNTKEPSHETRSQSRNARERVGSRACASRRGPAPVEDRRSSARKEKKTLIYYSLLSQLFRGPGQPPIVWCRYARACVYLFLCGVCVCVCVCLLVCVC